MAEQNKRVAVDGYGIGIDGEYKTLLCSSLFYFRIPRSAWKARIDALLKAGYNTADVYFPWNFHETETGKFDFTGERDVRAFLQLCAESGLYVVARFGPYICSEWTGGALPAHVVYKSGKIRTSDRYFLAETKKWYDAILEQIVPFQYGRGGSIILAQLENELDFFDCDDVEGYISALRDMALAGGVNVPLFCCAGQGNAVTSGGLVEGLLPTYNFYPDFRSRNFDAQCTFFAQTLAQRDLPLLVTETGRETALHKREFAGGAKLIGAYNQVAGSNFEYFQAVNNWGDAAAAIVTEYDFDSMIDVLGRYTPEAAEARLFTRMLCALGERAAKARVSDCVYTLKSDFACPSRVNVLDLCGGGILLCLANLSDTAGEGVVKELGLRVKVNASDTVLIPVNVAFEGGMIETSNYEIYSLSPLVLYGNGEPDIALRIGNERFAVHKSGEYGGVSVALYTKEEMKKYDAVTAGGLEVAYPRKEFSDFSVTVGGAPVSEVFQKTGADCSFEENGIEYGGAVYRFETKTKRVLFENPADFMSVYDGGNFAGTTFERGKSVIRSFTDNAVEIRSEKWGACNFDESRESSLRIRSTRGVKNFYDVLRTEEIEEWRLSFVYTADEKKLSYTANEFDPIAGLNGYNSTRMPFQALYYRLICVEQDAEVFFDLPDGKAECALYVSGRYVGDIKGDRNMLNIGRFLQDGRGILQLVVRKRDWTERVGDAKLYVAEKLRVVMCPFGKEYMRKLRVIDPVCACAQVRLGAGEVKAIELDLSRLGNTDCVCVVTGSDYKLTAVCGGTVVSRMIAPEWKGVEQRGGSKEKFLLPADRRQNGKVVFCAESIGSDTCINFKIEY